MPPKANETIEERAARVQRLKAEILAGTFYRDTTAVVDKIEASAIARYAAIDRTGQRRITTCFAGVPSVLWVDDRATPDEDQALLAEFWTDQSRQSAENARQERQWRAGMAELAVAVQNAAEEVPQSAQTDAEEPEPTPAERTDSRRRGLLLAAPYLTLLAGAVIVIGRWRGWWR